MDAYIGEIRAFPYTYMPDGWLPCDGSLLAISQFSPLFALIGTMYGGNGTTTFGLPDLRGRAATQCGQGPLGNLECGETGGTAGSHGNGVATLAFTAANLPAHTHEATFTPGAVAEPVQPQVAFQVSAEQASGAAEPANGFLATAKQAALGAVTNIYSAGATAGTTALSEVTATATGFSGGGITGGTVQVESAGAGGGATLPVSVSTAAAMPPFLAIRYGICNNGIWPQRP